MASDDGLAKEGETDESKDSADKPRPTMRGVGIPVSRPPALPDSASQEENFDDFEAEATEIADSLADDMISDIDKMLESDVDSGWDELAAVTRTGGFIAVDDDEPGPPDLPSTDDVDEDFEVEATEIAVSSLSFPDDERDGGQTFADAVGESDDGLSSLSLDEDSLPDPIREKTPTFDEDPSEQDIQIPALGQPAQAGWDPRSGTPASGKSELPNSIHGEAPADGIAYRGDPSADDDFDVERTELLDSPFESEPAVAKLIALDGPASGQEFFVSDLRNSVGRGVNNSVVVADLAMSRQHFEIIKNPDESYTIRDLQSVNGTALNGTKIREADLFHGDRLVAGKTTLQFVVSGGGGTASRQRRVVPAAMSTVAGAAPKAGVPPSGAAPGKSESINRLIVWVSVGAAVVSLFLIAGIVLLMMSRPDAPDEGASDEPTASKVYLEGVEAVRTRDWDTAQSQFEKARKLDPSLDGIEDQLRRIAIEREAASDLEDARAHAAAGEFEEANMRISEIPRDSVYYSDARELLDDGRKSAIDRMFVSAQEALTNEDLARSQALVEEILDEVPTHQGARELKKRIASVEKGEDTVEEVAAATAKAVKEQKRTRRKRRPRRKRSSDDDLFELVDSDDGSSSNRRSKAAGSGRVPNFVEGYMLYKTRKFDRAQAFFEEAANDDNPAATLAEKIARNVAEFQKRYDAGTRAFQAGNWPVAERELIAAKRADSAIASSNGYFDRELSTKLATAKANLGLSALSSGHNAKARRFYKEASAFNSSDPTVEKLEDALEKKATSLWIKAQHLRKTDRARAAEVCRDIMQLVPEDHPNYKKAHGLLKDL